MAIVANTANQIAEHVDFLVVEAAGGLVERQDLRLCRKRARQLDALLGAERQTRDQSMRDIVEFEIVENLVDLLVDDRFRRRPRAASAVADDAAVVRAWVPTRILSSTVRLGNSATF